MIEAGSQAMVKATGEEGIVTMTNGHAHKVCGKWYLTEELKGKFEVDSCPVSFTLLSGTPLHVQVGQKNLVKDAIKELLLLAPAPSLKHRMTVKLSCENEAIKDSQQPLAVFHGKVITVTFVEDIKWEAKIEVLGNKIRAVKEELRDQGLARWKINTAPEVLALVEQLIELKGQGPAKE
mmetsp:Transcript_55982/g.105299  ORF Transcript_55982/g.105299 Transcript_55982/m.105299 type:complete len:179 (+) Transcript_55982:64-600(+)